MNVNTSHDLGLSNNQKILKLYKLSILREDRDETIANILYPPKSKTSAMSPRLMTDHTIAVTESSCEGTEDAKKTIGNGSKTIATSINNDQKQAEETRIQYGREFLLALRFAPMCFVKQDDWPDIDIILNKCHRWVSPLDEAKRVEVTDTVESGIDEDAPILNLSDSVTAGEKDMETIQEETSEYVVNDSSSRQDEHSALHSCNGREVETSFIENNPGPINLASVTSKVSGERQSTRPYKQHLHLYYSMISCDMPKYEITRFNERSKEKLTYSLTQEERKELRKAEYQKNIHRFYQQKHEKFDYSTRGFNTGSL